ncbi:DUF1837 domain-containing protein [Neptunomonas phycophila]|uniref:DUF1837 domain-containing protein n=1 Tax=Neptunomonas phycophila TaxID=1572645 RepID=A0AAW7XHD0_9GAMM|nr:DUF1837 domain-containing protein [Neptunomonas phycophila]MDO6452482.1 DUF1837 domain-containing protein [Neptunomonas phycophila]
MEEINTFTSVDPIDYEDCIGVLEHEYTIEGVAAKVRMHYIKFDGNGRPMIKALANMLYTYIIDYCLAARNRPDTLSSRQSAILIKEARGLFRHPEITAESPDKTGEAGELLLYFLMEAVLKAPQMVSKMELKTNHKDEVKGSDGIHARFDSDSGLVEFFFGESKLYSESSSAIAEAINSVEQFHEIEMYQHEFSMVTKHFKHADEDTKNAISSLIISGEPGPNVCVNHACLIGYDFTGFSDLPYQDGPEALLNEFISRFLVDGERLTRLLQNRFNSFDKKYLCFDVFFIPFPSVSEFRNAFNTALD